MPIREWEDAKKLACKISHKYLLIAPFRKPSNLFKFGMKCSKIPRFDKLVHTKLQQIFNHFSKVCHQEEIQ